MKRGKTKRNKSKKKKKKKKVQPFQRGVIGRVSKDSSHRDRKSEEKTNRKERENLTLLTGAG